MANGNHSALFHESGWKPNFSFIHLVNWQNINFRKIFLLYQCDKMIFLFMKQEIQAIIFNQPKYISAK